jgi:hypothetical protein
VGEISLQNTDDTLREARIYQTDYLFQSDGSNSYDDPGTQPRSNAKWIRFSPSHITVPPHQSATVSLEVQVPTDSVLSGTFWSLLMIEQIYPEENTEVEPKQAALRQILRYGVQCITHLDGGNEALHFSGTLLEKNEEGQIKLQVDVENSGERWAVPSAWMELFDTDGRSIGRFDGGKKRIFPGTSVPAGKYKALVVLDEGAQNMVGAKYDIEF